MKFILRLYRKQVDHGRVLLHEQPAHAKSWMIPDIRNMVSEVGVTLLEADQGMYGLRAAGTYRNTEVHAKRPTKFMTSSRPLGEPLSRKYDGNTHPSKPSS